MGQNIFTVIKDWIGTFAFNVFLWSRGWTEEKYIQLLEEEYGGKAL